MKTRYALTLIILALIFISIIGFCATLYTTDKVIPIPTTQTVTTTQPKTTEPVTAFEPYPVQLDVNVQWYINAQCEVKGIPTTLALALIWKESRYQADVISATDDYGLMQVNACNKAEVERVLNVTNLLDPFQNVKAGLYILDRCLEQTDTLDKALMVYNLGESGAQAQWQKGVFSTEFSKSVIHKMNELER